jgi:hypothetical protein
MSVICIFIYTQINHLRGETIKDKREFFPYLSIIFNSNCFNNNSLTAVDIVKSVLPM